MPLLTYFLVILLSNNIKPLALKIPKQPLNELEQFHHIGNYKSICEDDSMNDILNEVIVSKTSNSNEFKKFSHVNSTGYFRLVKNDEENQASMEKTRSLLATPDTAPMSSEPLKQLTRVNRSSKSTVEETLQSYDSLLREQKTKDRIRTAKAYRMLKYMNAEIDPCNDFYAYACGNWEKYHPIPRDKVRSDTFEMLSDKLDENLRHLLQFGYNKPKILQSQSKATTSSWDHYSQIRHLLQTQNMKIPNYDRQILQNTNSADSAIHKARNFYKSCMDTQVVQKRGIRPLLRFIEQFGAWPVLNWPNWCDGEFDWLNLTAHFRRYNNNILISQWVASDCQNSDKNIIQFDQAVLGLPKRDYYLQPRKLKYLKAYEVFIAEVMEGFGVLPTDAKRFAAELITFEVKLAGITTPDNKRSNLLKIYKRLTLRELHESIPDINWSQYLTILQRRIIMENEPVIVYAFEYLHELPRLVESTDKRIVANYLYWRFASDLIGNIDNRFEASKQKFYRALFGQEENAPRWKTCIAETNEFMGMALGSLFVSRYFDEDSKIEIENMAHEIQQAFMDALNATDWLDCKTKYLAKVKLNAMSINIGYPDFILNKYTLNNVYKEVHIKRRNYFENTLNILSQMVKAEQQKLNKPVNKTDSWPVPPGVINACYNRNTNQIIFPAGILQPPFFHRYFPRSLNFGGIGAAIGHELIHGFDDKGRLYDENGNMNEWWSDQSIKGFDERARCIVEQYGNYTIEEIGVALNGKSLQGENIADNGGIQQAFNAYKRWLNKNSNASKDEYLPGMNMTGEQLFFLNFGQVYCGAIRPEALFYRLHTDVHSPGEFRVIGTFSNSEDFARAFKCPSGSRMNPLKKCKLW